MRANTEPCPNCQSTMVQLLPKKKVDLSPTMVMWLIAIVLPAAGSELAGRWGLAVGLMIAFWLFLMGVAYLVIEVGQFKLRCSVCKLVWFVFPWQLPKVDL